MEEGRDAEGQAPSLAPDPVGLALTSIGAGATTGAACITAGALTLRLLQARGAAGDERTGFTVIASTALTGLLLAAATGWLRTRAINDRWRRGVAAAMSAFGAALLAVVATPADVLGGTPGVGTYTVILLIAVLLFHRAAARAARAS